jgi:hypothetical protein
MVKSLTKEQRKNALLEHIRIYGTVDGMIKSNPQLYRTIIHFDKSLLTLVTEIDLEWKDVSKFTPTNHYKDFNNLKDKINEFINKEGRFPSKIEIIKDLGIQQRNIDFHGGIYEIKRKMEYISANDLVDDNGFENSSILEYKVAQFLIKNGISYKREQHSFPREEGQFRSDFMIVTKDDIVFHVELWGFSEKDGNGTTRTYNKKKKHKLELYKKYRINLISLEYDSIYRLNLSKLQEFETLYQNLKGKVGTEADMESWTVMDAKKAIDILQNKVSA